MYTCTCMSVHICICRLYTYIYIYIYFFLALYDTCIYIYICIFLDPIHAYKKYIYIYTSLYVFILTLMFIFIFIFIWKVTYIYIYIHIVHANHAQHHVPVLYRIQNPCLIRRCLSVCMYIYNMCSPIYPLVCFHACHVMAVHGCFLASAKWPCAVSGPMDQCGPPPWSHVALLHRIQHGIKHASGKK